LTQKITRREFLDKGIKSTALLSAIQLKTLLSSYDPIPSNKIDEELYYIKTQGNPFEIGRDYAEQLGKDLVRYCKMSVEMLERRFEKRLIKKAYGLMLKLYQHNFPYLIEEMRGMAEGARLDFETIALMNFSAGFGAFIKPKDEDKSIFGCPWGNLSLIDTEEDGCTNVIFPKSDRGPIMGRTLDGSTPNLNTGVVRHIRPLNGNTVLCFNQLNGLSTVHGLNNKGLAVGEASLHFPTLNPHGVIRNHLPRVLLQECATVAEGIKFLARYPVMRHGFHFALLDKEGNAAIVERSPTEMYVRHSSDDPIFCTNHCATPAMRKLELSRGPIGDKNSDERYKSLEQLTSQTDFKMTLNNLINITQYHKVPGGICQHGDLEMYTRRSFLVIPNQGKLLVSNGPGCVNKYHDFIFE
jgi:isopenicillin-N N-acyltransferase-like protein